MNEKLAPDVAKFLDKNQRIWEEGKPIPEKLELPTIDKIYRPLVEIAETVADTTGTLNPVEIFTADQATIDHERSNLFEAYEEGREFNPTFSYSTAKELDLSSEERIIRQQMRNLKKIDVRQDRLSRLFKTALFFKLKDDLATCQLVKGLRTENEELISSAYRQKYPGLDQSLLDLAEEGFVHLMYHGDPDDQEEIGIGGLFTPEQYKWLRNTPVSTQEQVDGFKWMINKYGLLRSAENPQGFLVISTKDVTGIDIRDKSSMGPAALLPTDRPKPMMHDKFLVLSPHEIEAHILQSANGEALFYLGGGRLKIDNEQMYEGRGLGRELDARKRYYGQEEMAPRPYYVYAARMAQEGASFYRIFEDQMERHLRVFLKKPTSYSLPPLSELSDSKKTEIMKKAWLTTYRVMRGHTDTSNKAKFAMTKDLGYLRGYQMDKQLKENGLGYINEAGIIASGALPLIAEIHLTEDMLPYPYQDATTQYINEVVLPKMPPEIRGNPLPLAV